MNIWSFRSILPERFMVNKFDLTWHWFIHLFKSGFSILSNFIIQLLFLAWQLVYYVT